MATDQRLSEEFPEEFVDLPLRAVAEDTLIYASQMDDVESRKNRTEFLAEIMDLDVFEPFQIDPPPDTSLGRVTMYCLSDFVKDMLLRENGMTRG